MDYKKLDTSAWFDYEVQKLCSISASMTTMAFNKFFYENVRKFSFNRTEAPARDKLLNIYLDAIKKGAMFDARCFNIPKEEVTNLIYWRQLDATRNSIQMVGQANFSHKELQNKTCNMIQDMLHEQKGINWNDYPTVCKRGSACIYTKYANMNGSYNSGWIIDKEMPILKGEDRAYVDNLIYIGEEM